ncbi:hypothetical protein ONV78_04990 [Hahella sp. CR1]|uniref:hypothetical protein n=1 Tax=Hahella sp. CR1 TaxID=2992807 RepID=UPI0024410FAC|nr:hypothetical protein [Hahella sp. CR1]MDG9667084.1 hypothetical protein [Hahella sp. CR1]
MAKHICTTRAAFVNWLSMISGMSFRSVSYTGTQSNVEFCIANSAELTVALNVAPEYFPEGMYEVESVGGCDRTINEAQLAMALSCELGLSKAGATLGGCAALLEALAGFEFFFAKDTTCPGYSTAVVWVLVPDEEQGKDTLQSILEEHSVMCTFGGAGRELTLENAKLGAGMRKQATR